MASKSTKFFPMTVKAFDIENIPFFLKSHLNYVNSGNIFKLLNYYNAKLSFKVIRLV